MTRARVGVLALQGDFALHVRALEALGVEAVRITLPEHTEALDALVLPGGESSTMLRLIEATGLRAPLERLLRERPAFGTCAGAILLAREADRLPTPTFGVLDVSVTRNGYGRQVHSFVDRVRVEPLAADVAGVFIRAPRFTRIGHGVEPIATHAGEVVGVRRAHTVAIAFHPELTGDLRVHHWFLAQVAGLALAAPAVAQPEPVRLPDAAR